MEGLTNALSNGDVPDPYDLLFPSIRGSQLPPKTPIAIFSATGEATDFTFLPEHSQGRRVHPNQSPLNILEKRERERLDTLYYLGNG